MIKIELTNAINGVIKKVIDTQYNGDDQTVEITTVYELSTEDELQYFLQIIKFLQDVSKDLGLHSGSDYDSNKLIFDIDWGDKYNPTEEEVNLRIKDLKEEIKNLNLYKKLLSDIND